MDNYRPGQIKSQEQIKNEVAKSNWTLSYRIKGLTIGAHFEVVECFNHDTNSCSLVGGCKLKLIFEEALDGFFGAFSEKSLADIVPSRKPVGKTF